MTVFLINKQTSKFWLIEISVISNILYRLFKVRFSEVLLRSLFHCIQFSSEFCLSIDLFVPISYVDPASVILLALFLLIFGISRGSSCGMKIQLFIQLFIYSIIRSFNFDFSSVATIGAATARVARVRTLPTFGILTWDPKICSKVLIHYTMDPTIFSTPAAPLVATG